MATGSFSFFLCALVVFWWKCNLVRCEGETLIEEKIEKCKDTCRVNVRIRTELRACIEKCQLTPVPVPAPVSGSDLSKIVDGQASCVKNCLQQNPEGHALCEFKCKTNIPNDKQGVLISTAKTEVINDEEDIADIFSRVHSHMSKMMDCLMDGMNHQMKFGWAAMPNMLDSRFGKFSGDAEQFFKDQQQPADVPPINVETVPGNVDRNVNDVGLVYNNKEIADALDNAIPSYRPVLHRFIIIKKIPFVSSVVDDDDDAAKVAETPTSDSGTERFNAFIQNLFGTFPPNNDEDERTGKGKIMEINVDQTNNKALSSDGGVKESSGKFCDFLSNFAHKSGLKRTTLILLMTVVLLCFAWYCIATILSGKRQKREQPKEMHDDLEYLIPIEEKLVFFAHLEEKEKPGEAVQAPSIPIKIKIQDV